MRYMTILFVGLAGLLLAVPATAAPCCDNAQKMACCDMASMPCCDKADDAVNVLMSLDAPAVAEAPARQATDVWFQRPVVIDH